LDVWRSAHWARFMCTMGNGRPAESVCDRPATTNPSAS
jgi:hypothetical protein